MKVLVALLVIVSFSIAQDDLAKGKDAFNKKSYDEALQLFQKYLTANSRSAEANYYIGETYRMKGDLQNAQENLERSLDFDDEFEPALVSIIRVYGKLGMWDKAAKRYKLIEKYHKTSTVGPIGYAQTYLEVDSLDKASIYFSKAKEIDVKNVDAYVGLSEVYARQNVIVLAVDNLRTATQMDPTNPALWYKLATTIMKNRGLNSAQIQEIVAALQKSIELDPNNIQAIYDAANIFYRIKYWREAAEFFKKYVEQKKDHAEAWEKYGIAAYNAKAYTDAIQILDQAITLNPKNNELKSMLAHSLYLAKEYQKSLTLYKTFPMDSLSSEEIYRMGFSFYQLKDTANAIMYLDKTLSLDKENTDAAGTLAAIFLSQKKFDKAVVQYEKLLAKDPKNITALYWTAYSYYVLDKLDLAKDYYKKTVTLRPNNPQFHQSLGQIYSLQDSAELGRYHVTTMITLADSILKADPSKAAQQTQMIVSGYYSLGMFEYKDKNVKGAIEKLEKGVTYEKEKKGESLHLFLAQMYAISSGDKELLADEARKMKERACQEYAIVLKINPKNAAALKESKQMNCGK
ncbi:MAG: tetratricopeptide repeat protein [Bacteroidota bacterium]